ncbi:MAG: AMP-activated serine/threonine-protein kinase regulatory subunit [Trizodia sp. TS-e1964]|nr:MAG: AMP-activated serine/threonine-protein kinase regulatory subunit [Trizodia sp. TS-e1964]
MECQMVREDGPPETLTPNVELQGDKQPEEVSPSVLAAMAMAPSVPAGPLVAAASPTPIIKEPAGVVGKDGDGDAPCVGESEDKPLVGEDNPLPEYASGYISTPLADAVDGVAAPASASPIIVPISGGTAPEGFVQPASFLRPRVPLGAAIQAQSDAIDPNAPGPTPLDQEQIEGLRAIRAFLKVRTSYDVLPLSFRLIVLDTTLLIKKSLSILIQNGIVSAPLWHTASSTFAGMLTTSDFINVIQYYWQHSDLMDEIDQFRLDNLREVEKAIGVTPIETASIHPTKPLYEACRRMLKSRARRIPLVALDDETQREMVVSVITQYRILKFISANVTEVQKLRKPLYEIGVGTYVNLATANMETPVIEVIHKLVDGNISSVPILDAEGVVLNVFEAVDVIPLIKGGVYEDLNLTVGEALLKRSDDFPGIYTCQPHDRLETIFDTLRKSRVHRFVVIDDSRRLKGLVSLSDILRYILLEGEPPESR